MKPLLDVQGMPRHDPFPIFSFDIQNFPKATMLQLSTPPHEAL